MWIIAAVLIASIIAVFFVIKIKKKQKNLKKDNSKIQFAETKSNHANSLNVDDEDNDLDFWI